MKIRITKTYSEDFDVTAETAAELLRWNRLKSKHSELEQNLRDWFHTNESGICEDDTISVRRVKEYVG